MRLADDIDEVTTIRDGLDRIGSQNVSPYRLVMNHRRAYPSQYHESEMHRKAWIMQGWMEQTVAVSHINHKRVL